MQFKEKLILLLQDQAQNRPNEYVNPHLLGELPSALYDTGALDKLSEQDRRELDKYCSDMWGA